jgi:hypothetical protein
MALNWRKRLDAKENDLDKVAGVWFLKKVIELETLWIWIFRSIRAGV